MSLRERRATDARHLRARSLAIGQSGVGVTARKASHNASNARGVAAVKMGRNSSNNNNNSNNTKNNNNNGRNGSFFTWQATS